MNPPGHSHRVAAGDTENQDLAKLVSAVASSCGFDFVPPVALRRGGGGDWSPTVRAIRVGIQEWRASGDRLWYVVAHELAHAQTEENEGHSRGFWKRLAGGLLAAGRIELIRLDFGYREGALWAAMEHGLEDVPTRGEFLFRTGQRLVDLKGKRWVVERRFRRAGRPHYRLRSPGWTWTVPENQLQPGTQ